MQLIALFEADSGGLPQTLISIISIMVIKGIAQAQEPLLEDRVLIVP